MFLPRCKGQIPSLSVINMEKNSNASWIFLKKHACKAPFQITSGQIILLDDL